MSANDEPQEAPDPHQAGSPREGRDARTGDRAAVTRAREQARWVDLQVGVKGRRVFANHAFVGGWALAGRGESDLSTDVMLLAGYEINDRLSRGYKSRRETSEKYGF